MLMFTLKKQDFDELDNILERLKARPDIMASEVRDWIRRMMKDGD